MRMTSGSTAMARAMQRRCCWPPDRPRADFLSRSFTSSHRAAPRSERSTMSSRSPFDAGDRAARRRRCRRSTSGTGWASGRPCRCAGAPRRGRRRGRRGRRRGSGASPRLAGPGDQVVHAVEAAQDTVVLPQPDGPMNAVISLLVDLEPARRGRPEPAVEHRQLADAEHRRPSDRLRGRIGRHRCGARSGRRSALGRPSAVEGSGCRLRGLGAAGWQGRAHRTARRSER